MRILALLLLNITLFAQTQQEVATYSNNIVKPFNKATEKILVFNSYLMQGADHNLLIKQKNELLKVLDEALATLADIKPLENDFGFLAETKIGCQNYKAYVQKNYTDELLKIVPTTARENIKKIRTAQKASAEMEKWNTQFSKRQKKLLSTHKVPYETESALKNKTDLHKLAMDHYYSISINEFKVQAFVDDFIDAMNNGDKKGVKIASDKLNKQLAESDAFFKKVKAHKGDKSLINSSKSIVNFYKKLSKGLVQNTLKLNSYPKKIPNEKVEEYNNVVEKVNSGVAFLNTLQDELNKSQEVVSSFFKKHLV